MDKHAVVSREDWLEARKRLLDREKAFTRERGALAAERRTMPWVKVDEHYVFDGPNGAETLADLFDGRSQLVVYHFMFDPGWAADCKSCSFWADNFDRNIVHLNQRDVSMVAISSAPLPKLAEYQKRMGWSFKWLSAGGNGFNRDYGVTFSASEREAGRPLYNFGTITFRGPEAPGISVFYKDEAGDIFHTYSAYSRGLDALNGAYQLLDIVPKGRDEDGLSYPMAWVKPRDKYLARESL